MHKAALMISDHLKKLRKRTEISAEEERAIRNAVAETRRIPADEIAIPSGVELNACMLLLEGWMARSKDLASGERQITELHIAGDFVDLHSFTLTCLDHDVVTLTECTVALFAHDRMKDLTERYPHLARVYWLMTNIDAAIHREWVLSLGQRSAISRMAHLFCELRARLELVGRAKGNSYMLPLTQRELSECLGLTVVHANRTLQELRRRGVVTLENKQLTILDEKGLERIAEFDDSYLYLDKRRL